MSSSVALVADSLSALAPVRFWECLLCGKRWGAEIATGCPYCQKADQDLKEGVDPPPSDAFN
jgi:rubrerythrin